MKLNEIEASDEQLDRMIEIWPRLTPTVRRSLLILASGSVELRQKLNHGRGGVHPVKVDNILYMEQSQ